MRRRTIAVALLTVVVWVSLDVVCVAGIRLPLRPRKAPLPSSTPPPSDMEATVLLDEGVRMEDTKPTSANAGATIAAPRFVATHSATQHDQAVHGRAGAKAKARVKEGGDWAYDFDAPPKTLQPPWAKAPEMGEFDLPAPPPAWTPPPPPPMGMYGEERMFPPPPSPPPPPPPPLPPPPPKKPEAAGGDDALLEKSGHAKAGHEPTPFRDDSPWATLTPPPFTLPSDDYVDFSKSGAYPLPPSAVHQQQQPQMPPSEGNAFRFPGLPPVPPLESNANMPIPPRPQAPGLSPEEAIELSSSDHQP